MRIYAILVKEFIQMRRDRLTFALIVGVPFMQLLLFGFAINNDPKHLPAAVAISDPGTFSNSIVAALANSGYYDIRLATNSPAEAAPDAGGRQGLLRRRNSREFQPRPRARRRTELAGRSRRDRSRVRLQRGRRDQPDRDGGVAR